MRAPHTSTMTGETGDWRRSDPRSARDGIGNAHQTPHLVHSWGCATTYRLVERTAEDRVLQPGLRARPTGTVVGWTRADGSDTLGQVAQSDSDHLRRLATTAQPPDACAHRDL